jgi:hypothetical protein
MNKAEIIKKLKEDEHYYGSFGQKFLSNSNVNTLIKDPLSLHKPQEMRPAFLVGGYYHTAILEPDKLKKYRVIQSSTRNTKKYKELSDGEMCLLEHEVDKIQLMIEKTRNHEMINYFINEGNVEYEVPQIKKIEELMWKGKADVVNHDEKMIIDLKTTNDVSNFKSSAYKYGYNSQAFIYQELFGYEMLFIAIDKNTLIPKFFDCSPDFINSGYRKVQEAAANYKLVYNTPGFDPEQYFENQTL